MNTSVSWERPDLHAEREEILRTAKSEGLDLDDLWNALESGKLVPLTEQTWSRMENTDSYDVSTMEDAVELAERYKRDWRSIKNAYETRGTLPAPIVIMKPNGALYLVGGNTRLIVARAHNTMPEIFLAQIDNENPQPGRDP